MLLSGNYGFVMVSERQQRQIDRLLDEAEEAIVDEDWSRVASRARAVLDPEKNDGLAYLTAGERALTSPATPLPSQL